MLLKLLQWQRVHRQTFNNKKTAEASEKRKYHESYLSFGFTWTGDEEAPNGLCVGCETVLSSGCLSPAKPKRHLEAEHSQLQNIDYFKKKNEVLNKRKKNVRKDWK